MIRVVDTATKQVQECKRPGDIVAALTNVLKDREAVA